jgi:hypothetical protein
VADPAQLQLETLEPVVTRFDLEVEGVAPGLLQVLRFEGVEGLSEPFRFDLDLASVDGACDLQDLVGRNAVLSWSGPGGARARVRAPLPPGPPPGHDLLRPSRLRLPAPGAPPRGTARGAGGPERVVRPPWRLRRDRTRGRARGHPPGGAARRRGRRARPRVLHALSTGTAAAPGGRSDVHLRGSARRRPILREIRPPGRAPSRLPPVRRAASRSQSTETGASWRWCDCRSGEPCEEGIGRAGPGVPGRPCGSRSPAPTASAAC